MSASGTQTHAARTMQTLPDSPTEYVSGSFCCFRIDILCGWTMDKMSNRQPFFHFFCMAWSIHLFIRLAIVPAIFCAIHFDCVAACRSNYCFDRPIYDNWPISLLLFLRSFTCFFRGQMLIKMWQTSTAPNCHQYEMDTFGEVLPTLFGHTFPAPTK